MWNLMQATIRLYCEMINIWESQYSMKNVIFFQIDLQGRYAIIKKKSKVESYLPGDVDVRIFFQQRFYHASMAALNGMD